MKFMLMMQGTMKGWVTSGIGTWPPEDIKAHIGFMKSLNRDLQQNGEFVEGQGLATPEQTRIVRAKPGTTEPEITDGPFAEAKEFLAGFWIIDVETPQRAYEIAARASSAPGKGGKPLNMPIEVREVMSAPPVDL
jgi:hypothetical protein